MIGILGLIYTVTNTATQTVFFCLKLEFVEVPRTNLIYYIILLSRLHSAEAAVFELKLHSEVFL